MSQKIVISRIQNRRGLKENLPQPLLPGELALAVDEAELWIGSDPQYPPWGIRLYEISDAATVDPLLENRIADIEFVAPFLELDFDLLVNYLLGSPTPGVGVIERADIRWDGLNNVIIKVQGGELNNLFAALQGVSSPVAAKYLSGQALIDRSLLLGTAFDGDGIFFFDPPGVPATAKAKQAANAATLVNLANGEGIVTTLANLQIRTEGVATSNPSYRTVNVLDTDPGYVWAATGSMTATNPNDFMRFIGVNGVDIDINTANRGIRFVAVPGEIDHNSLLNYSANQHALPKNSIELDAAELQLVGDVLAPGNEFYYGTNTLGTKGWYALPVDQNLFETVTVDEDLVAQSFTDGFNYTGTPPAPWYDVTAGLEAFNGVLYPDPNISSQPDYYAFFDLSTYDISNTKAVMNINGLSAHSGPGFKFIYVEIAGSDLYEAGTWIEIRRYDGNVYEYHSAYFAEVGVFVDETGPYVGPVDDIELEIEILANILTFRINGVIVQTADISAYIAQWTAPFVYIVFNEPEIGTTVGVTNFEATEIIANAYTWNPTGSVVASITTDELTLVEGGNISLDVDAVSQAIRITANIPPVTAKNSIELDVGDLQLVGDILTPGNEFYYGTNGAGAKGWYALPTPPTVIDTFVGLTDTPANYTNEAGSVLYVNGTADGVAYAPLYVDIAGAEYIAGTLVYPDQVVLESSITVGAVGFEQNGIRLNGVNVPVRIKSSAFGQTASILCHQHSTTNHPQLLLARANSNSASHVAVTNGMSVGELVGAGWAAVTPGYIPVAHIDFEVDAIGTVSDTSMPGRLTFRTTPDGAVVPADAMYIDSSQSVVVGAATGGAQGAGTINAEGVYVNGVEVLPQVVVNDSVHTGFVPTETEFLLVPTVQTIAAQTAANFDGLAGNGTFTSGLGYAGSDTITLSDGSVITANTISTDVSTIAAQTQVNFDGGANNGTFTDGAGYVALDTITLNDGSVITVNTISTDVGTIAAQTQVNFDGGASNGTFVSGSGYAATNTINLSDGSVVTVNAISTNVSTIAAQNELNFDGGASNGTFVSGLGYAALDTITLSDGSVITVDVISTDVSTIAAQNELNFDGGASNGTFVSGIGYAALDTITLSDGSVITVDVISTNVSTIAAQNELNFDGGASNGTFVSGIGYAALDTITLSDGSVITVDVISTNVSTIAAQTQTNFDGVGSNGTFVGGDGAGGTAYVVADTITLSDGSVITVDTIDANDDVATFTITTASTSGFATGATLTQSSTSGTGTAFTLTTGTNNEASFGDITDFTVTTDSTSGFATGATLTQSTTTGSGTGFTLTTAANNEASFGDITDFTVTTDSTSGFATGATLTQSSTSGTGTGFTLTTAANNEASFGDITDFTVTTDSTSGFATGATLTQSSTSGTGTGFTLTTAANNEAAFGDITTFTITTASTSGFATGSTLTQASSSGAGTGFTLTTAANNEASIGDIATFTITTASTAPYTAGSTLTQSTTTGTGTGFSLTTDINNEDQVGDIATFTITTGSTSVFTTGATLTQVSSSGAGTGFSLTTGPDNEAPSSVSTLAVSGFAFNVDAESDVILVEYSLNSGAAVAGANNFTAIGSMKIVANANAEGGLATLIDDQTDVRDTAYTGAVGFEAAFVAGAPNEAQVRYSNTLTSDVTMRIVIRRWMSY